MANFAYVENGQIIETCNELPVNWRNVSNLNALKNNEPELNILGWYTIIQEQDYDDNTHIISKSIFTFIDDQVHEAHIAIPKRPETTQEVLNERQWFKVRVERNAKMNEMQWRYERNARQVRLGLIPTDDIAILDSYMQALADITTQEDPFNIIWPTI